MTYYGPKLPASSVATQAVAGIVRPGWGHFIYGDGSLGATILDVRAFGAVGDGVADDTASIQAALNAASNQGWGRVMIPAGQTYLVSAALQLRNSTILQLDGTLKLKPGSKSYVLGSLNAAQNVLIEGVGTIDGGYAGALTGNQLAAQQGYTSCSGVIFNAGGNIRLHGITIQNFPNMAWSFGACSNVVVDGVTVLNQGNTSGFNSLVQNGAALPSVDCWAANVRIDRTRGDYGFGFYGANHRCGITGSNISGSDSLAVCVLSDAGQGGASSDIVIAGNILHDNPGGAIGIQWNDTATAGVQHSGVLVTGNRCFNNCTAAGGPGVSGVYLTNGQNVVIADNHFGPDGGTFATVCIAVVAGGHGMNATIQDNVIVDQGLGAGNGSAAVFSDGTDANTIIRGNTLLDTRGAPKMQYGVLVSGAPAGLVVEGNTVRGCATPIQVDAGAAQVRQSGARYAFDAPVSGPSFSVGARVADASLPVQVDAAAGGAAFLGVNKAGSYGLLLGYDTVANAAVVRQVTADPLDLIVNNTTRAMRFLSSGAAQMPVLAGSVSYATDAAAAAGGVAVGQLYRNGSAVMVRVA